MHYCKFAVTLTIIFLVGCIPGKSLPSLYPITQPDIFYLGDSLCHHVFDVEPENILDPLDHIRYEREYYGTAAAMLGMRTNCVPGRQLMKFKGTIPSGLRITFIALGSNDVVKQAPIDAFKQRYEQLLGSINAGVTYCILPNKVILDKSSEPYRIVIRQICENVIDPLDAGVRFTSRDTTHMVKWAHVTWANYLLNYIHKH